MFKENSFETPERKVNPIRPKSRQINVRRFKMTTILEQFSPLVPCFMTFSFQVLCGISEKKVFFFGPCFVCVATPNLPLNSNPNRCIASKCPKMTKILYAHLSLYLLIGVSKN